MTGGDGRGAAGSARRRFLVLVPAAALALAAAPALGETAGRVPPAPAPTPEEPPLGDGGAARPATGTTVPGDSLAPDPLADFLDELTRRSDDGFSLDALTISDAEVDSLLRAYEETGEAPYAPPAPGWTLEWEIAALRYNRVEGVNILPQLSFSSPTTPRLTVFARGGYGWASRKATWSGGLRAGLPGHPARPTVEVAHSREVYAYGSGGMPGNTLAALAAGQDYADYFLGEGWSVSLGVHPGHLDIEMGWRGEEQSSLRKRTTFALFDRDVFRENPAIDRGTVRLVELGLGAGDPTRSRLAGKARGTVAGGALGGDFHYNEVRAEVLARQRLWRKDELEAKLSGGAVRGDAPFQALHHLGGTKNLRGFEINEFPARRWAHLSLDYGIGTDFLRYVPYLRRLKLQPVPFFDAALLLETQASDGTVVEPDDPRFRFSVGIGIQQNILGIPGGTGQLRFDIARRLDRDEHTMTYRVGFTAER